MGQALARLLAPERAFVDKATEIAAAAGLADLDYRVGQGEALPYDDDSFDLVTCQTLLIQVRDPAVVLGEMRRVLRPGGTVLLAEPNSFAWFLVSLLAEPRQGWTDILKLQDGYRTCLEGKKQLGFGDSSLGERLPGLVAAAGFDAVDVALNENAPAMFRPYVSEAQQIRLQLEGGTGGRLGFGPRDDVLRFFKAGGGEEPEFVARQQGIADAIEAGTYAKGGGGPMYLVTGRKPGPAA